MSLTAKDVQGLPKNASNRIIAEVNAAQAAAGGAFDGSTLFDTADDLDLAVQALAKGVGVTGLVAVHKVRGVATADVSDLGAFDVDGAESDGLTYAEGERILLANQSTGAENGVYVVGAVAAGVAPLTRALDWADAEVIPTGTLVVVDAGTANANTIYMVTNAGDVTVDTTTPTFAQFRERIDGRQVANVADDQVIGGVPVTHVIAVPSGASGDVDVVLTHKTRVLDVRVQKIGAGGAGDLLQVKNGANAITDDMDTNVADHAIVRPATIDNDNEVIAAGGTLRCTRTEATDGACVVTVTGVRVA